MNATRIVVSGATGRMGSILGALVREAEGAELVGGIAPAGEADGYPRVEPVGSCAPLLEDCDVVIDFSAPEQLRGLVETHAETLAGRALVVGTTGMGAAEHERLDGLAERAAVLVAANFSVGVNLLLGLAERAARALPGDRFDVEIVEAHHRRKADAPSGTALALGKAVARGREVALEEVRRDGRTGGTGERPRGEIAFHALRGGDIVGEHRVHLIGASERIELAHAASDRAVFAEGALHAALWLAGRDPGHYTMADVLGL